MSEKNLFGLLRLLANGACAPLLAPQVAAQQVRTQVAAISHSLSWTPGHLAFSHFSGVGMTGTSEETPVVAPKKEEVVKLSNSFKEACVLTKSELVTDKENFYSSHFVHIYLLS